MRSEREPEQGLHDRSVIVIGAGALGAAVASCLARAGVGRIGIVDPSPGLAERVAAALGPVDPGLLAEPYPAAIEHANAGPIVTGSDAVVDAGNDPDTHRVVADACAALGVPLVVAGLTGGRAWLTAVDPRAGGRWRGVEEQVPGPQTGLEEGDVAGWALDALAVAAGTLAALEGLKLITGIGTPLTNRVLVLDGLCDAARTSVEAAV